MTRLFLPVSTRDHMLGAKNAPFTLVEYGHYACSHCASIERTVMQQQRRLDGELRFVYRHFPPTRFFSSAQRAAEAAEAAGAQGKFWEMHRLLFGYTHHLEDAILVFCAATLRLDMPRFLSDLNQHVYAERVREDFESGLRSGVSSTPTFYINGVRHDDFGDADTLLEAMERSFEERVSLSGENSILWQPAAK
ncbi:MAG TPA: thioredoxin domain-containing protein [Chthonomonadaceae bacterium]|nr:thioredoxin domain-containing protein [Chthonomonadaceae bacterium]